MLVDEARLARQRSRPRCSPSAPLGAPLLYSEGNALPAASAEALRALRPLGRGGLGGAQVIRIGTAAAVPEGLRTRNVPAAGGPAAAAAAVAAPARPRPRQRHATR